MRRHVCRRGPDVNGEAGGGTKFFQPDPSLKWFYGIYRRKQRIFAAFVSFCSKSRNRVAVEAGLARATSTLLPLFVQALGGNGIRGSQFLGEEGHFIFLHHPAEYFPLADDFGGGGFIVREGF